MERPIKTIADAQQLLAASELITSSIKTVIAEWSKETTLKDPTQNVLPSRELYQAQRTILAATGLLTELVAEPHARVIELACEYWESRALFIAAQQRIPDLIAEVTATSGQEGVPIEEIANRLGIEKAKLSRVLRCLTSAHFFKEVAPDVFANNSVSASLIKNEQLRAYCLMFNLDLYTASDHLPRYLVGENGHSYAVDKTPWQDAIGTSKPRWDWLEEKISPDSPGDITGYPGMPGFGKGVHSTGTVPRPEHEIFGLAMVGGGKVFGVAHLYDYPWADLGKATVVDVGGGAGGFDLQLNKLYPNLSFVVQDRGPVLQQAKTEVWPKENPAALAAGRVSFVEHDFFQTNPTPGADVYWLRYILHDWSDDYCIQILKAIKPAMTSPNSRILICDQVMNTTLGCDELESAPSPLPANYGYSVRYSHQRDLAMMGIINGIERTPSQFRSLVEAAGLRIAKIWDCRSQVSIVEIRNVEHQNGINGTNGISLANGTNGTNLVAIAV